MCAIKYKIHLKRIYYLDKLKVMNENTTDKIIFFTYFCYIVIGRHYPVLCVKIQLHLNIKVSIIVQPLFIEKPRPFRTAYFINAQQIDDIFH